MWTPTSDCHFRVKIVHLIIKNSRYVLYTAIEVFQMQYVFESHALCGLGSFVEIISPPRYLAECLMR